MLNCDSCFPRLALVAVLEWVLVSCSSIFRALSLSIIRLIGRFCLHGRYQLNFLLFWKVPLSCWEILSLKRMSSFALLDFTLFHWKINRNQKWTTVLLRTLPPGKISKGFSIFFGGYHCLTGNPNECSQLFWGLPRSY